MVTYRYVESNHPELRSLPVRTNLILTRNSVPAQPLVITLTLT